jgi:hypothetical protein
LKVIDLLLRSINRYVDFYDYKEALSNFSKNCTYGLAITNISLQKQINKNDSLLFDKYIYSICLNKLQLIINKKIEFTKEKGTYFYFVKNTKVINNKYYTLYIEHDKGINKNIVDICIVKNTNIEHNGEEPIHQYNIR